MIQDYTPFAFEFPNHVEAAVSIDLDADTSYSLLLRIDSRSLTVEKAQAFQKFPENRLIDLTEKWKEIPIITEKLKEIENAISH